jgi:hypothetical protein
MYYVIPYNDNLNLTEFYAEADRRGFKNNSSKKAMIDCFQNEKRSQTWIVYKDGKAVASFAAHSFDDVMGPDSYRILTRVCVFAEASDRKGMITLRKLLGEHQTLVNQICWPVSIEWAGTDKLYSTSNASEVASQNLVHTVWFPTLEKYGLVDRIKDIHYRGIDQTVWKTNIDAFYNELSKYPKWTYTVVEDLTQMELR